MTHISRPFQIALVAMVLFIAVWFVALRGHSTSSAGSASSASSGGKSAVPAKAPGSGGAPSSPGSVYHGAAPGVAGLTRAITKAQGAVAQSQQNARQLQEKSAQASSAQPPSSQAQSSTQSQSAAGSAPGSPTPSASSGHPASVTRGASSSPAKQLLVERQLKRGQTVILLFWNPTGSDDVAVRGQLQRLQAFHKAFGRPQNKKIAVHEARAKEVALFGSITRSLQINQTPTMLVISPAGNTKTLTGLVDAYTIQQAISEARHS